MNAQLRLSFVLTSVKSRKKGDLSCLLMNACSHAGMMSDAEALLRQDPSHSLMPSNPVSSEASGHILQGFNPLQHPWAASELATNTHLTSPFARSLQPASQNATDSQISHQRGLQPLPRFPTVSQIALAHTSAEQSLFDAASALPLPSPTTEIQSHGYMRAAPNSPARMESHSFARALPNSPAYVESHGYSRAVSSSPVQNSPGFSRAAQNQPAHVESQRFRRAVPSSPGHVDSTGFGRAAPTGPAHVESHGYARGSQSNPAHDAWLPSGPAQRLREVLQRQAGQRALAPGGALPAM